MKSIDEVEKQIYKAIKNSDFEEVTAVLESWEEDIVDEVKNGDKYEPF